MTLRVLVLYGGRSSEHTVSCWSAKSVLAAIDPARFEAVPVGITRDGRWVLTDGTIDAPPGALPEVADDGPTVTLVHGRSGPALVRFDDDGYVDLGRIDVAFPVLHGPYGEDGTIQGLLATIGVPYVGADVTASSIGIDKTAMKAAFAAHGLPLVPHVAVREERWQVERDELIGELSSELGYPAFTKPARQGSSIGIRKVRDDASLAAGLDEAFTYDRVAIVERAVEDVREIEVGVIGNAVADVSAAGEVIPGNEFYDFEAKYLDDALQLLIPAPLEDDLRKAIDDIARQAYLAIGCRGMARIDFFVRRGDGALFLNEINTIPGFTPASMFPRLWQAAGMTYPELVDRLLDLALDAARAEAHFAP